MQQAPLAVIEFCAVGYDPKWLLEVDRQGPVRFRVEGADAIVHSSATGLNGNLGTRSSGVIYGARTETHELVAEILEMDCMDAISGERLTHVVTIRVDAREYRGCGRGFGVSEAADQ